MPQPTLAFSLPNGETMRQKFNAPLLLALGIPGLAIVASFMTLALAIARPDGELPEQYHWEGMRLDRDFETAQRAADLNVAAALSRNDATSNCQLDLRIKGSSPEALTLVLTHATHPSLDQRLTLRRSSTHSTRYDAPCAAIPNAHWRVELTEPSNHWSVRQYVTGPIGDWKLSARVSEEPR